MPLVALQTNASPSPLVRSQLLEDLATITANLLGKPVEITMATIACDQPFHFRGNREPTAQLEVRAIGLPDATTRGAIAFELSRLLDEVLGVPPSRTFVLFQDVPRDHWAVGGQLLG